MKLPPLEDSADFVIVGTGAGGATAARVLSAAGLSVIMVEEGPHLRPEQRERGLIAAMGQSMRDMATLSTSGSAPFPLLAGRCVGGSTAINSGIIWRLPESVRAEWARDFGLGELLDERGLGDTFDVLDRELGVGEVAADVRGGNARLMQRGAEALGLPGQIIKRNAPDCKGRARCLQGCPEGARQSMDVSYVPRALADGARLLAGVRATGVLTEAGRATGIEGERLGQDKRPTGQQVRLHARRGVIVAAGALHTPVLLRRSGLRGQVGDHYQAHPGVAVVGRFSEQVGMGFGATQAYQVPMFDRGFKLESISLPPELLAARLPGVGEEWQRLLRNLDYFAQWASITRVRATGRIRPGLISGVHVRYEPGPEDVARIRAGAATLVRMMFAAGAEEVYPGVARLPEVFQSPDQAARIEDAGVRRQDFHLMASHHFASARASDDPRHGAVDSTLQSHDLPGLYVMDAATLPTATGVNPQHTIMAVVMRAAEKLANSERPAITAA